jgi:hypothetical protein
MAATLIISASRQFRSSSPYCRLSTFQRRLHTSHASRSPLLRYPKMVETARRRIHGDSADKGKSPTDAVGKRERHDHEPSNAHSHSHGIFGGHSHSHDHDEHGGGLIETLQSGGAHLSRYLCPVHFPTGPLLSPSPSPSRLI